MISKLQLTRMGGLYGALITGVYLIATGQIDVGLGVIGAALTGLNPPREVRDVQRH